MSSQYKYENHRDYSEIKSQSKVKLTDLLNRINQEKHIVKMEIEENVEPILSSDEEDD